MFFVIFVKNSIGRIFCKCIKIFDARKIRRRGSMNTDIIREKQDLIEDKKNIFANKLSEEDKETIF